MKLEQDFLNFIREPLMFLHYPPMTSYHRMIVHRVAAYFGMDHNVDQQTGKSVIINKTMNTRIPESRFLELIPREESEDLEGAVPRLILKRHNTPSDDSTPPKIDSPVLIHSMEDKRSKSIEEKLEEYYKAGERIFNLDSISSQSSQYSKGDGDLPPTPQLLQREDGDDVESDLTSAGEMPERKPISKLGKSKSEETEVAEDRTITSSTGIRIMTNKPFHRSASSPGISSMSGSSAFELVPNPTRRSSAGSQRINPRHVPSSQTVLSPLPYWVAEGVPFVAHNLPSGEVQMVPVQNATPPGVQTMVPVMATPSATASPQTGGVMWPVPQEPMQHGVILINPNTDANHLEHSKAPDNWEDIGSFQRDLDDDVDECRGAISIILKKENHRQDLVPKEVYRTRVVQEIQRAIKMFVGDKSVISLPELLPCRGIEQNPGTSLIMRKDESVHIPPLKILQCNAELFCQPHCSYSPLLCPICENEKVSDRITENMVTFCSYQKVSQLVPLKNFG
ncbi:R3H domain-containing protein 1-like [Acropora millepora]|uniref:R3H domain-containing protein 1-like n=1 Tax=Acropora millepora TaxID=45264 RepID=UPI001CF35E21|nr:R3H domain-containing protein 1-like [Acropora millepora]